MGRRIYDVKGNFVWKYTFGRQGSCMCAYTESYGIGEYVSEECNNSEDGYAKGDDAYYEWEDNLWIIKPKTDLPKLKKLHKQLLNGYTEKDLAKIGMDAIHLFVSKQSKKWQKIFADDLKWVLKVKSCDNFKYYGCGSKGENFEIYDIYAKAIEKKLVTDLDFLLMTRAFIKHIAKYKSKIFIDEY